MSDKGDNAARRYLTPAEMERLISAAGQTGDHGQRDRAMLLVAYKHGLRVSELVGLQWHMIDFKQGRLHTSRLKSGLDTVHPLQGDELRALRAVRREWPNGDYVFQSERGGPLARCQVNRIIARAGVAAEIDVHVFPHMLRHSCGYALANAGTDTRRIQDYLGHVNINHTVRYTRLDANRFKDFAKIFGGTT